MQKRRDSLDPKVVASFTDNPVRPLLGKRYLLGHEWIDGELSAIADGWLRAVSCEPIQFPFFIFRMKKLLRSHFDHEAILMRSSGSSLCECHHQEHRTLIDLCDQANALSANDWRRTQSLLRKRFPKLIRDHIIGMDQIAVLFIDAKLGATAR